VRDGKTGTASVRYSVVYVDGKLVGKTRVSSKTLAAPVSKIEKVGTKSVRHLQRHRRRAVAVRARRRTPAG